jgi:hypothetical protein
MGESKMDKKPLMGVCIGAVVLLILGSLSNVVGYQSVKSTVVNDSPLYSVRTQRATEQQQNILTSRYLGKENGNLLYFPVRDNKSESLKNFFESIKKMDDATFQKFLTFVKQHILETTSLNERQLHEIKNELTKIRKQGYDYALSPSKYQSSDHPPACFTVGGVSCLIGLFLAILGLILFIIILKIKEKIHSRLMYLEYYNED